MKRNATNYRFYHYGKELVEKVMRTLGNDFHP